MIRAATPAMNVYHKSHLTAGLTSRPRMKSGNMTEVVVARIAIRTTRIALFMGLRPHLATEMTQPLTVSPHIE